jgi:hypothetical protein
MHTLIYACLPQLKRKYKELKKGVGTIEKTRLGRYRAIYIPFRDAGSSVVRETVCMVDGETTSQEDIYDFVLTAKKLTSYNRERNRKNDQVNLHVCNVCVCMCSCGCMCMCVHV